MIRTYVVMYVVRELITLLSGCMFCSGFFATTRKHVRREKPNQNESDIVFFARKRYTVTVNGIPLISQPDYGTSASLRYIQRQQNQEGDTDVQFTVTVYRFMAKKLEVFQLSWF